MASCLPVAPPIGGACTCALTEVKSPQLPLFSSGQFCMYYLSMSRTSAYGSVPPFNFVLFRFCLCKTWI